MPSIPLNIGTKEIALLSAGIILLTTVIMGIFGKKWDPRGQHCYVTGGSAGLGLEVAIKLAQKGANVSIVARDEEKLRSAHELLEANRVSKEQKLHWYSFSLNTASGSAAALEAASAVYGGACPDASFLCAGAATPGFFVEQSEEMLLKGMENGYWVQAWSALEIVKSMVRQGKKGCRITFVGSTLSYMSFAGYSPYAPPKHALRGLADTLRSELLLYSGYVHFYVGTTMNTPGYEQEMKTKPKVTAAIEGEDPISPAIAASQLLKGVEAGRCHIQSDFVSDLFRANTRGSAPYHNNILWEVILMLIGSVGIPIFRWGADAEVMRHRQEHQNYLTERGLAASSDS